MRLVFALNNLYFLRSHRMPLVREARRRSWKVTVIAGPDQDGRDTEAARELRELECDVRRVRLSRSGVGPLDLALTVADLRRHYRDLAPDIVHHVTPKLVTLGTIAARSVRAPAVVNAISGLGVMVSGRGVRGTLQAAAARAFYSLTLRHHNQYFIVQNERDRDLLERTLPKAQRFAHFFGSGVDLTRFKPTPLPDGVPIVVLAARLLREKGIYVLAEAARRLKRDGVHARFVVCGAFDPGNPGAVSKEELRSLVEEGVVEYWGVQSSMEDVYSKCTVACLPSYYGEGLPLALAEAASAGRAIVTTDMPGCRDTVVDGESGFLVPARDAVSLAARLREIVTNRSMAIQFGRAARALAESRFSVEAVVRGHFDIYSRMLAGEERK